MKTIKDLAPSLRPREKVVKYGVHNLSELELVQAFLGTGVQDYDVRKVSRALLSVNKGDLLNANYSQIQKVRGIGQAKTVGFLALREFILRLGVRKHGQKEMQVFSPVKAARLFLDISNKKKEILSAVYLNSRRQIISREIIAQGGINTSSVYPKEIFYPAIQKLASFVVIAHNHPSGELTPSVEDQEMTDRVINAGKILGIRLLDHIIVTPTSWFSILEEKEGDWM